MSAEEIFLKAVEKGTPAERAAFLDGVCGTDAALRAEVEGLIASDEEAGHFLEDPLFNGPADTVDRPSISEGPGTISYAHYLMLTPPKDSIRRSHRRARRGRWSDPGALRDMQPSASTISVLVD